MVTRADRRTWKKAEDEIYSDFDISFGKNPVTGSLIRVTNDDAVKQSIRNIILTMRREWPHHPSLGSKIHRLLFEPLDSVTGLMIKDAIVSALVHEPRASVHSVRVIPNHSSDGYDISIIFSVLNKTEPIEFREFLKRIR